eukprot:SAG11_NODE_432_length_9520_cov_102.527863_1_plen_39_part_00
MVLQLQYILNLVFLYIDLVRLSRIELATWTVDQLERCY